MVVMYVCGGCCLKLDLFVLVGVNGFAGDCGVTSGEVDVFSSCDDDDDDVWGVPLPKVGIQFFVPLP